MVRDRSRTPPHARQSRQASACPVCLRPSPPFPRPSGPIWPPGPGRMPSPPGGLPHPRDTPEAESGPPGAGWVVCSRERLDTQAPRVGSGAGSAAGWGPRPALPVSALLSLVARFPRFLSWGSVRARSSRLCPRGNQVSNSQANMGLTHRSGDKKKKGSLCSSLSSGPRRTFWFAFRGLSLES